MEAHLLIAVILIILVLETYLRFFRLILLVVETRLLIVIL